MLKMFNFNIPNKSSLTNKPVLNNNFVIHNHDQLLDDMFDEVHDYFKEYFYNIDMECSKRISTIIDDGFKEKLKHKEEFIKNYNTLMSAVEESFKKGISLKFTFTSDNHKLPYYVKLILDKLELKGYNPKIQECIRSVFDKEDDTKKSFIYKMITCDFN